jgi:hypothetical protein
VKTGGRLIQHAKGLLAAAGGKRSDLAPVRGDGGQDCRLIGGDGLNGGRLTAKMRSERRRGMEGLEWKRLKN